MSSADQIIEVDTRSTSDYDSTNPGTETQSVSSSVFDYTYDNGRRYTKWGGSGKYVQPNDETEQDRLDMVHHYQNIQLGGELHLAPISNPHRILDCGTGTGIWALDAGDRYPSAEIIGIDLSPIQPGWVVPNVKFELDDLEKDWTFKPNYFDFIHSRHIATGIRDWQRYLKQMYTHLAPGGWIELSEHEQTLHCDDGTLEGSAIGRWFEEFIRLTPKAGLRYSTADELVQWAKEAGFVDIQVHTFKQPWGAWPKDPKLKEIGKVGAMISEGVFDSYGLALFTSVGGWSEKDARQLGRDAYKDVLERKVHAWNRLWHIVARKPEA